MALFQSIYFYLALAAIYMGLRMYFTRHRWAVTSAPAAPPTVSAASLPSLVVSPAPPRPRVALSRQSILGVGTMELPTGPDWEREHNPKKGDYVFFHPELEMVIAVRNQHDGMQGYEQEYLDSYDQVNVRDAPNWQRGPEQRGQLAGLSAARTGGQFYNSQAWVTRDYLLFGPANTVILQTRVPATKAQHLAITDYLAATFQPANANLYA